MSSLGAKVNQNIERISPSVTTISQRLDFSLLLRDYGRKIMLYEYRKLTLSESRCRSYHKNHPSVTKFFHKEAEKKNYQKV